jgi:hypothetical protein
MVKLLSPCVPYAQSLGAVALADDRDIVGQRLAHDRRFDQAHTWALAHFAGDPVRLSTFLCELAMFCATFGRAPEADAYFLEALEKCDPSHHSSHAILAATLAHSLGRLEGQFPQKVLERLPTGHAPSVSLQMNGRRISLPVDVPVPLAQDIVANIVAVHFSHKHGDSQPLLDQLVAYLEDVTAAAEGGVPGGSTPAPLGLAEITLAVLGLIAQMRKRAKDEAGLQQMSRDIEDCLRRFGEPLDAYPAPLASHLTKFVSRRYRLQTRLSGAAKQPAVAATKLPPGVLHRLLDQLKSLLR